MSDAHHSKAAARTDRFPGADLYCVCTGAVRPRPAALQSTV